VPSHWLKLGLVVPNYPTVRPWLQTEIRSGEENRKKYGMYRCQRKRKGERALIVFEID
jgi:hypothetical protein